MPVGNKGGCDARAYRDRGCGQLSCPSLRDACEGWLLAGSGRQGSAFDESAGRVSGLTRSSGRRPRRGRGRPTMASYG